MTTTRSYLTKIEVNIAEVEPKDGEIQINNIILGTLIEGTYPTIGTHAYIYEIKYGFWLGPPKEIHVFLFATAILLVEEMAMTPGTGRMGLSLRDISLWVIHHAVILRADNWGKDSHHLTFLKKTKEKTISFHLSICTDNWLTVSDHYQNGFRALQGFVYYRHFEGNELT